MKARAALAALLFMAFAGPAAAQQRADHVGMTVLEVFDMLTREGISANRAQGGEAGKIIANIAGAEFEIVTYNCDALGRCRDFLFTTGFDLPAGFPLDLIKDWNALKLAGRAYLDADNDPFLDHLVSMKRSDDIAAFRDGLYLWVSMLDVYVDFIAAPDASV